LRKIVGVEGGPIGSRQDVPIRHPHHHGGAVLRTEATAVFCELLQHVPLKVTVKGQDDVTTVDGVDHGLSGARKSDAIRTPLICCHAIIGR